MESHNLAIIISAEICLLFGLLSMFLLLRNRSLRKLVTQLQSRMESLVQDLRQARAQKKRATDSGNYKTQIQSQLDLTRSHHKELGPKQDIILDIDPASPLPLRAAAIRHAVLLIEMEAAASRANNHPDWKLINQKYDQLFSFQEEYQPDPEENENHYNEELENFREELTSAKKRINNLEKFKTLYFELEEKWQACKDNAQTHYDHLSSMADLAEDKQLFESTLNAYHNSYAEIGTLINQGVNDQPQPSSYLSAAPSGEISHLRAVAADQHRIINELQRKLDQLNHNGANKALVDDLKEQLDKQIRFAQESETCIQLMEDELSNAHKELESLKSRSSVVPQLKTELKELRDANEELEMQMYTLRATNQRLTKDLKSADKNNNQNKRSEGEDTSKIKKELVEMQAKYAELEEKFLDLKIQG